MTAADSRREAVRNRLLRRVDWRFLLPQPAPARSVCFAGGELAEGLRLISKSVAAPENTDLATCDLAVASDPDADTLHRVRDLLRPGGVCYVEWRSGTTPRNARRRLEEVGFHVRGSYLAWPDPESAPPRCWVPVETSGALRFVRKTPTFSFIPGRLGVRTPILALHRLQMAARLLVPLPLCVVALKPEQAHASRHHAGTFPHTAENIRSTMPDMVRRLLTERRSEPAGGSAPESLSWVLLTPGRRSISKVVGLVFAEPEPEPRSIIKLSRVPEAVTALRREAETLEGLHATRDRPVPGVPRVLFREEQDGMTALGQTFVPGVPLWVRLRRCTYRRLARGVTDWLVELAGRAAPAGRSAWGARMVDQTLETFVSQFGAVLDPARIRKTEAVLNGLEALPMVVEHRDLGPWNVLVASDGGIGVLDWESAEREGLPMLDLVYFLTYQAFFHEGAMRSGRFRKAYRALLQPSTFTGGVFDECLARYTNRLRIARSMMHPLRLLCWMIHTRSDHRHLSADVAGQPDEDSLRESLFLRLWEEELMHGDIS